MSASSAAAKLQRERVGSLERGLAVLCAFGQNGGSLTITEAAAKAQLTRAAARRMLLTLQHLGYVKADGRVFSLTPRVLELGVAYLASQPFGSTASPLLAALAAATGETASVGVLDGLDLVYVVRVPSRRLLHLDLKVGRRLPAHVTSSGRVLLADLTPYQLGDYFRRAPRPRLTRRTLIEEGEVRASIAEAGQQGWACVRGEVDEAVVGLAVPIRDGAGRIVAALNLSTTEERAPQQVIRDTLLPALRRTTLEFEHMLPL